MPKKIIETGIFKRTEYENQTISEKRRYAKLYGNFDIYAYLKEINVMAQKKLKGVVTDFTPGKYKVAITKEEWDANPLYYDALDLTDDTTLLLYLMDKGDIERAVIYALRVGMDMIRWEVRPHEKPAVTGRNSLAYLAKLREARSKKVAVKHNKIIELFNELKNQYEPHERPSDRRITKEVSEHLHLEFKTVESILYRTFHKSAK